MEKIQKHEIRITMGDIRRFIRREYPETTCCNLIIRPPQAANDQDESVCLIVQVEAR